MCDPDEGWDCPVCGQPTPPEVDVECGCGKLVSHHISVTTLCRQLREARQRENSLLVEVSEQARLLGMSAERECDLRGRLEQVREQYRLSSVCRELKAENEKLKAQLEEKEEFIQRVITWPHDADPFFSLDHDNDETLYK